MWRLKQLIPKEQVGLEGKSVEVGSLKLQIRTTIAQGGFSSVYLARDAKSGKQFAVKHIICNDTESLDLVKKEVATMKALRGHPNIITLHAQSMYDMGRTKECFLVLEYCDKMLVNVLDSKEGSYLDERQVLLMFRDVCNAVYAMHSQSPPIAHRDLKAENVLLGSDGLWKLCDFGSTSTNHKRFDRADEMGIEEDIIRKHTTPAYRAPEMWDLYRRDVISEKVDIWALGCLLYRIAYQKSAFDGESKLQILNGNYRLPDTPKYSSNVTGLIKDMLNSNPEARPDAMQVWLRVNDSLPSDSRKVAPDKAPSSLSTQPTSATTESRQPLTMPTRAPPPLPPRDAERRSPPPGRKEWDHGTSKEANYHTASSAEKSAPMGSFWSTQYAQEAQSDTDGAAARDKSFISGSPPGRPTRTANVHVLSDQQTAKSSASSKSGTSRKVNDTVHHTKPFLRKEDAYESRLDDDLGDRLVHSKDNTGLSYKGLQESTKITTDEAFSEFVAEFQKTTSEDTYVVTEASHSEVESLKMELKQVQAEKIDIASKYEKLTAICRSQRLEIQELKSALAAAQGQSSKSQAKETAQTTFSQAAQRRPSQSSSEQRPDKQVGSIWDLQEGLSFSSSTRTFGSEQQGWKAFDDAPGFQASPKLQSNRKEAHHDATGGNEVFGSARFDGPKFDSSPMFDSPKYDSPKSGALNGNGKKQPHARAASFAVGDAWGFQDSFSALGGGFEVAKSTGQSKQSESASGVFGFNTSKDEGRSARVVNQTQPAGWAGF